MRALPSGVVAFLMSDVESSTRLWQREGAAMDTALAALDDVIHRCVDRAGGVVIKARGEGDSHFAAFDTATAALCAAVSLQRERADLAWPKVRVALHVGECRPLDGDYLGALVNQTARVRATAHGGQIVCTRVVADLVGASEGIALQSLGAHRIRDVALPIELFQATGDGLPAEFPPLMTVDLDASPVMTTVVVDQVHSTAAMRQEPSRLSEWQRTLFRALRAAAREHDGRFVKLLGDGCLAAFDDPRSALAFAAAVCATPDLRLRAAVTAGVVDVVEGELSGTAVYDAFTNVRSQPAGNVWISPVVRALVDS